MSRIENTRGSDKWRMGYLSHFGIILAEHLAKNKRHNVDKGKTLKKTPRLF